ncbi:MAG TPA: saccharopine dehydrogenase NADP-binding domain-containing protein [Burkholderiaceae bacterium]|nr:saccharopine dehydrogenase NADP-binding domain-containing protein [Burkholderiaceae bacterium]
MSTRPFDLVLYGATGFVGRRAAAYLATRRLRRKLRWAIAGRDPAKLAALRDEISRDKGTLQPPGIVLADSGDVAAVEAMAASTRVLITTAGPFALYGDAIVDACAQHRTHYADITGETTWVRRVIDRLHARAARDGTRIVPFCGFDSVPSDLGALLLARYIESEYSAPCVEVRGYFRMMGGFNGGTLATNAHRFEAGEVETGRDPFLLNPRSRHSASELVANQDVRTPHYDEAVGGWVAPFIMGSINTRVVRRSAALNAAYGTPYGPHFSYQEYMRMGGSLAGAKAVAFTVGLRTFERVMEHRSARTVLGAMLPRPGEGPSEEAMARGWFKTDLVGRTADGRSAWARIGYDGDPGNRATLRILCEGGLALAFDGAKLPGGPKRGGVLTPATAIGETLVPRLRAAGFEISVGREPIAGRRRQDTSRASAPIT